MDKEPGSYIEQKDIDACFTKMNEAKNVALICHDIPDPDCIGPCFVLYRYFESKGINAEIFYGGSISHYQNRALINILNIPMISVSSLLPEDSEIKEKDRADYCAQHIKDNFDLIILVDSSCVRGSGNVRSVNLVPHIIIDHHDLSNLNGCSEEILIINQRCGSTASLISYIFEQNNITLSGEAATALFIGLMSDTDNLSSNEVIAIDETANRYLLGFVDFTLYTRIMHYDMPAELLKFRRKAYGEFWFRENNLAIVGIGYTKPEFKDLLGVIAQETIRIEGINKVVVLGVLVDKNEKKSIVASVRTQTDTINTDGFSKRIFGNKSAGGKQGAGGANIAIDSFISKIVETDPDQFFAMVYKYYKELILEIHTEA